MTIVVLIVFAFAVLVTLSALAGIALAFHVIRSEPHTKPLNSDVDCQVRARTSRAPATLQARAQSLSVDPVVSTSSINNTERPDINLRAPKAPATFAARS